MARTKASVGAKVSSGKSSKARCSVAPQTVNFGSSSGREKSSRSSSGGNPVCPRETPKWQKPITTFFAANQSKDSDVTENGSAGSSKSKPKRNIILSDEEDDTEEVEKPVNTALDETIELEPLTGENSHKIEEYYENKGKGRGKKSNKENVDGNKQSKKRDLDDIEETQANKKRKVA